MLDNFYRTVWIHYFQLEGLKKRGMRLATTLS